MLCLVSERNPAPRRCEFMRDVYKMPELSFRCFDYDRDVCNAG